ncbi:probable WRKY transcription factor 56 isoform X2 [Diospyros lotus]|uniref:probable WRKY transcription factor 56 isoform X2 n=1 Tax=Diospyros lotus TaxID=55363 RepID=UPI0022597D62|nr:probable WRKY transcription factor 56 isoform X2 [Diospyros lotus]
MPYLFAPSLPPTSSMLLPPPLSQPAGQDLEMVGEDIIDEWFSLLTGHDHPHRRNIPELPLNVSMNRSDIIDHQGVGDSSSSGGSNKKGKGRSSSGSGGGRNKRSVPEAARVAFHTRSSEDVLDDGYRWRKYGQKAVKNSMHPRSYYRCTYHTCNVKKQIQRLSRDTSVVVTTYEGIHNHPSQKLMDTLAPLLSQLRLLNFPFLKP